MDQSEVLRVVEDRGDASGDAVGGLDTGDASRASLASRIVAVLHRAHGVDELAAVNRVDGLCTDDREDKSLEGVFDLASVLGVGESGELDLEPALGDLFKGR